MGHHETIEEILKQFDSYTSNCIGCDIDSCKEHNLICRKKLMEAAEELDETVLSEKGIWLKFND